MKKITLFILISCYMLMTTGVVAVSHYCMDRLASVSLFAAEEKKCGKCGMEKEQHSCCNDQETLVKGDADQYKAPLYVYNIPALNEMPVIITDFLLTTLLNGNNHLDNQSHSPPLPDNDLYLANNVFRI